MFGLRKLMGAYLDVVSELRSKGHGIGLMRLTSASKGKQCHINPYHIFVVMSHREGRAKDFATAPNTDIVLSATSMIVTDDVESIVRECREKWGIPFVKLANADMKGKEYWLNARKAVTVFPDYDSTDRCCVRTGKFHVIVEEDAVKCAKRINAALRSNK